LSTSPTLFHGQTEVGEAVEPHAVAIEVAGSWGLATEDLVTMTCRIAASLTRTSHHVT